MGPEKILYLNYYQETEYDDDYINYQEISNNEENISYYVRNLNECPEDAIIGRDLFDVDDYVKALKLGIELAKKGYTDIKIKENEGE